VDNLWYRRETYSFSWPFPTFAASLQLSLSPPTFPPGNNDGYAHFIEHLLLSENSDQLQRIYDSGGTYNGFSTVDRIEFLFTGPCPLAWDLHCFFNAPFHQSNWLKERSVLLAEIDRYKDERPAAMLGTLKSLNLASPLQLKSILGCPETSLKIIEWSPTGETYIDYRQLLALDNFSVTKLLYPKGNLPPSSLLLKDEKFYGRVFSDLEDYLTDPMHFISATRFYLNAINH